MRRAREPRARGHAESLEEHGRSEVVAETAARRAAALRAAAGVGRRGRQVLEQRRVARAQARKLGQREHAAHAARVGLFDRLVDAPHARPRVVAVALGRPRGREAREARERRARRPVVVLRVGQH